MNHDIKIMGDGFISPGEYEKISVMGDATSTGNVKAIQVKVNGNAVFSGDCDFGSLKINGDATIKGSLISNYLKINGDLTVDKNCELDTLIVRGDAKFNYDIECNNVTIYGDTNIKGNLKAKEVRVIGHISVDGDIECENIVIDGSIDCNGLINSEDITIYLKGKSRCNEVGATNINIRKQNNKSILTFLSLSSILTKSFKCSTIEGDYIKLKNCDITNIRGKQVDIISNCNIDNIEYTSNLNISKNSTVKNHVKIG